MNFKKLGDGELIEKTKGLAAEERRLQVEVLHHLREIEVRGLHLKRGFSGLFEFAVKALGYTDAAAARRVQSMRLLFNLPTEEAKKVEASLNSGELSLSTLSTLQRFFKNEKAHSEKTYDAQARVQLIDQLKNKSAREAERVLAQVSPQAMRPKDSARAITATETVVKFTADEALMKKLERLKEVLSHQLPSQDLNTLLNKMADIALKHADPAQKKTRVEKSTATSELKTVTSPAVPRAPQSDNPRYIPEAMRLFIMNKAEHRCEFVDGVTRARCNARHYLQIDHITPVSQGGKAALSNLRALCAAHNRARCAAR